MPAETVAIRARMPADMDACVSLLGQVHERNGYPLVWPADPGAWLSPGRQLAAWVAVEAGVISGHVALTTPQAPAAAAAWAAELRVRAEDLLCVSLLFVAPQATGRGIGKRFLDTALATARARGAAAVLEVVSLNRQAVALYRAQGWR